ncbi:hypothetical protein KIN20_011656 [Parelaphostrongylus tenuis]|uniref:Uncharacterized protein n=1 Tax=Parelaphostrongylus tenuis TaxID=148309 RepID=A0AAD5M9S4_PARTN|nr:hypothetical protein KIN20_011656 [Parelaphostrongylus tenuis]
MTIASPRSIFDSSESEFDNTQIVIPSFESFPKISSTFPSIEVANGPAKNVGGGSGESPPTTNYSTSAKKLTYTDITNASEKQKQNLHEVDIDEELLRHTATVINQTSVEMNNVHSTVNDIDCTNVSSFHREFKPRNGYRLHDGSAEILNDDDESEICVIAPPNSPTDIDHKEGLGVE